MSPKDLTYMELIEFSEKLKNMGWEEKGKLCCLYSDSQESEKIKAHILSMFPLEEFKNCALELTFIDDEKKMAVITARKFESLTEEELNQEDLKQKELNNSEKEQAQIKDNYIKDNHKITTKYLSYYAFKGVKNSFYDSFDQAIIGCLVLKYSGTPISTDQLFFKILDVK